MEWIPSPLATVAAWVLTATFAWAVAAKLARGEAWSASVAGFGFGGSGARVVVFAVPVAEAGIVILFASGAFRPAGGLTLSLVAAFSAAIVRARAVREENKVPCGCFGGTRESDYRLLLARNGGLAILAALVLLGPRAASLAPPAGVELVPTLLVVLAGVLVAWVSVQTVSSLRRR